VVIFPTFLIIGGITMLYSKSIGSKYFLATAFSLSLAACGGGSKSGTSGGTTGTDDDTGGTGSSSLSSAQLQDIVEVGDVLEFAEASALLGSDFVTGTENLDCISGSGTRTTTDSNNNGVFDDTDTIAEVS